LRKAFDAMMRDPAFIAEAERSKIEVNEPMGGEAVQQAVEALHNTDPALIRKASAAFPGTH